MAFSMKMVQVELPVKSPRLYRLYDCLDLRFARYIPCVPTDSLHILFSFPNSSVSGTPKGLQSVHRLLHSCDSEVSRQGPSGDSVMMARLRVWVPLQKGSQGDQAVQSLYLSVATGHRSLNDMVSQCFTFATNLEVCEGGLVKIIETNRI